MQCGSIYLLPKSQPAGNDLLRIQNLVRVINLRGHAMPDYSIPDGVEYFPIHMRGGPDPVVDNATIHDACKKALSGKSGTVVIHCQHGQNRTGLVFCICIMAKLSMNVESAMQTFGSLRPPGIERSWCAEYLRSGNPTLLIKQLNFESKSSLIIRLSRTRKKRIAAETRHSITSVKNDSGRGSRRGGRRNVSWRRKRSRKSSKVHPNPAPPVNDRSGA